MSKLGRNCGGEFSAAKTSVLSPPRNRSYTLPRRRTTTGCARTKWCYCIHVSTNFRWRNLSLFHSPGWLVTSKICTLHSDHGGQMGKDMRPTIRGCTATFIIIIVSQHSHSSLSFFHPHLVNWLSTLHFLSVMEKKEREKMLGVTSLLTILFIYIITVHNRTQIIYRQRVCDNMAQNWHRVPSHESYFVTLCPSPFFIIIKLANHLSSTFLWFVFFRLFWFSPAYY